MSYSSIDHVAWHTNPCRRHDAYKALQYRLDTTLQGFKRIVSAGLVRTSVPVPRSACVPYDTASLADSTVTFPPLCTAECWKCHTDTILEFLL